jgi:hypothetical protein
MSSTLQGANALTASLTSGLMVIGTAKSGINTSVTIQFAINGKFAVAKTAITSAPYACEPGTGLLATAPNAFVNIPVGKACAFAWLLDSAGAVTCAQGDIVDEIGSGTICPVPAIPPNRAVFGASKVRNTSAAAGVFIPATTLHDATGVTSTFVNLSQHPGAGI